MMTKFEEYTQKSTLITTNKREDIVKDVSAISSDQDLMEFYSNTYEHVDVAKFLRTERKERLLGLLNLIEQGESYIDVGCANGAHMEELYKRGIYGIGLDVSIPNILRGLDQHPYLKFVHGFAEDIPFGDHYFDVAILGDILEHFRDQKCALSEILRVVKKGFVICFPNDTKYTVEHINPVTIASFAKLCQQFVLHVVYFDKDGNRLSEPDESFYWVFARAEKTEATEKICLEIQAERNRDKTRVLESDQWKQGECHDRHQTEQDRFTITSLALMGKDILEVACGNGDLSVFLVQKGFHVTGIDISEVGISQAISYAKQEKVANMTNFLVMDGTQLNFDDNTFDSVIFPEVFEHVINSRRYISEAIRVLKPGGRIFISVPDTLEISWPGHIRLFTKETLSVELDQYTDNIIWYEMNFKKWLLCAFTPNAKKGNDVVENLPLVNILMSTYNRANVIKQAIDSIIHQTYNKLKLLILNDGGEDISEIVRSFHDDRISYHEFEHNGKAATLNHGLQLVDDGYIAYMDDDDLVFPNHIESLVRAAILYQKDFVFSDTYLTSIDKDSGKVLHQTIENTADVDVTSLKFFNQINHKQILHTKSLADRVGLYDERLQILIDYDYIKRLALLTTPFHIKLITGNHFLYYDNHTISTISGLWDRDQKAVGESLLVIFSKHPQDMYDLYIGFQQQTQLLHAKDVELYQLTPHYTVQLFIDTSLGFNETQSITKQIQGQERTIEFDLGNYADLCYLRFDPANAPAAIHLVSIELLGMEGERYSISTYQTNACHQNGQNYIFDTNDPMITFASPAARLQKVVITLEYIALGNAAYPYIYHKQAQQIQQQAQQIQQQAQQIQQQAQQHDEVIRRYEEKLSREIHSKTQLIQIQDDMIQTMENTLSWKITKPLRVIRNYSAIKQWADRIFTMFRGRNRP